MKKDNCIFCKIIAGEIPSHTTYEDENLEFLTFTDILSAVINIIHLQKNNLNYNNPIEFTQEEKSNIGKYRNQDNIYAKSIVDYYDKCEEVIAIINKYYDSTGKLKKN